MGPLEGANHVKFGVNTFIWSAGIDQDLLDRFPSIRERGFDSVELPMIEPENVPVAKIRKSCERAGLACDFCSVIPHGMSAISEDPGVRAKTRAYLEDCIRLTADAGAAMLAGPLYSPVGYLPGRRRTADEWDRAVEFFQDLGDTLQRHGVTMAIEALNRFETYFLNTAEDALKLANAIDHPNVGLLFDTFHANIEEKDIAAALRLVAPRLRHVHACENDRGTPGSGHVDWPGVFGALREQHYDEWLTIESFGFAIGGISAAASIWRDLAASAEDIAFDGVRFLRSGVANS